MQISIEILNFFLFILSISLIIIEKMIFTVGNEKPQRRGSVGSLDSGMSISYTSASTGSRDTAKARFMQQQFPNIQTQQNQPNHAILNAMNSGISPLLLASGGLGKK